MNSRHDGFDICVVGAGPAGMAAAVHGAESGARVVLIDASESIGGQFWRHRGDVLSPPSLYHDADRFQSLAVRVEALVRGRRLTHLRNHHVWTLSASSEGCLVRSLDRGGTGQPAETSVVSRRLVLATGAFDRQIPFPGWDLPGVIAIGGLQALLKGSGVVAGPRVVVAGTGPFIVAAAAGLVSQGGHVIRIHDANHPRNWAWHARAVVSAADKLREASEYAAILGNSRVPISHRSMVITAEGTDRLERVTTAKLRPDGSVRPGTEHTVDADVLAVGWGFVAQLELPIAAGCEIGAARDGSPVTIVDRDQRTTNDVVFAAGELTGIGGAALASVEGAIAGIAAAGSLGIANDSLLGRVPAFERKRTSGRRFASALDDVYPVPAAWPGVLTDETVICRCEEVSYAEVKQAVTLGAHDVRTAKLLSRAGMGWCQGRMCSFALERILPDPKRAVPDVRSGLERAIAWPVSLGSLASDPEVPPCEQHA